jgi:hypothetical protein
MQEEEINSLIVKYINDETTEKETKLIDKWYASFDGCQGLTAQMTKEEIQAAAHQGFEKFRLAVFIDC